MMMRMRMMMLLATDLFMIHNDESNYDDHDDTLPEHLGQVPNTASPKIEVVSRGVDFVLAFFPNRRS